MLTELKKSVNGVIGDGRKKRSFAEVWCVCLSICICMCVCVCLCVCVRMHVHLCMHVSMVIAIGLHE